MSRILTEAEYGYIGAATDGAPDFRRLIEISQDELTVTKDRSKENTFSTYLVGCVVALCFALYWGLPFSLFLLTMVGIGYLLSRAHNLRCTRETLEVIDIIHYQGSETRSFSRTEVKGICFGAVSYSKYGAICGLVFEAAGKKIKMLYGLKSPEAQKILGELERLGFDVIWDPGMPMMVEMETSRRQSWFGRWFT